MNTNPKKIGVLNRKYGYNGFAPIVKGTSIFEEGDRYFFYMTLLSNNAIHKQRFYKNRGFERHIDFDVNYKLLKIALSEIKWVSHNMGDQYSMISRDGRETIWKVAYYPLFGTYRASDHQDTKQWVEFEEPRVLIERPIEGGTDFREVPFRYLNKIK